MRFHWFGCALLVGLAYGQAAPAPPPAAGGKPEQTAPPAAEKAHEKTVGPDETVLTLKGVCADAGEQGGDCKTKVSRAEFEKLAEALQPSMPPAIRRQLANAYARMLLMSRAAEKRGLDKTAKFEEVLRFARMQILSQQLSQALEEDANNLTDADLENYYHKNAASFEEADFLRIFIPRARQITNPQPSAKDADLEAQQKAGEAEMQRVADGLRARARKGEDFDKLQKEAFVAAGLSRTSPDPKMSKIRRTSLPAKHAAAFDLKPGEVSELISDASGYYIYKVVSRQTLPLDSVKTEIRKTLSTERYREAIEEFQKAENAELNDAYFGPTPKAPALPSGPGGKAREEGENNRN